MIHVKGTGGGVNLADATATAADVLLGKTSYAGADKNIKTGAIPIKAEATITPGTAAQTIAAGQYLSGEQTIQGDANLLAENIKSGISIFGVAGSLAGNSLLKRTTGSFNVKANQLYTITGVGFRAYWLAITCNNASYSKYIIYDYGADVIYADSGRADVVINDNGFTYDPNASNTTTQSLSYVAIGV